MSESAQEREHSDLSFEEIMVLGENIASQGAKVYFKFTCEKCGERVIFREPNTLYRHGECNKCGHENRDIPGFGMLVIYDAH